MRGLAGICDVNQPVCLVFLHSKACMARRVESGLSGMDHCIQQRQGLRLSIAVLVSAEASQVMIVKLMKMQARSTCRGRELLCVSCWLVEATQYSCCSTTLQGHDWPAGHTKQLPASPRAWCRLVLAVPRLLHTTRRQKRPLSSIFGTCCQCPQTSLHILQICTSGSKPAHRPSSTVQPGGLRGMTSSRMLQALGYDHVGESGTWTRCRMAARSVVA